MKIAQDVYLVGSGQVGLSNGRDCHVYLLDGGGERALIDVGVGFQPERIVANLAADGYQPADIDYILLTHSHADHAGGCRWWKAQSGAQIVCTAEEGRLLASGSEEETGLDITKRAGIYPPDYTFPYIAPDRVVAQGETLHVGRYTVRVIEAPGHSLGTTCYLVEGGERRMLFSGDAVFWGGTIGLGNWAGSTLAAYRQYIDRLAGLEVDALFPGHYLWTLEGGQRYLDLAIENLKGSWVPPNWGHHHPAH